MAMSESDFAALERLVALEAGESPDWWHRPETPQELSRLRALESLGLARRRELFDSGEASFKPTVAGRDLVHDAHAKAARAEAEKREQRRHDFRVAAFGAVTGGVLGLFSGGLGGWLVTQAIPAIAQALSR